MRSLLKLLLLPLLAYGGAMGYLWYEIKNGTDEAIKQAAAFADVRYDSVHLSPLGDEIGLNGLVIKPTMTADEFKVGHIHITGPYPGFFLVKGHSLSEGKPPEKLGVQIRRLEVDIDSELFTMLEQMEQQQKAVKAANKGPEALFFDLDALGCGNRDSFTMEDYRNMGIGLSVLDIDVNLAYNEADRNMHVSSDVRIQGLYSLKSSADLEIGSNGKVSPEMVNKALPNATIHYYDEGYHTLRNDYCTGINGTDVDAYLNRHLFLASKATGLALTENAVKAYKQFKRKGGHMEIEVAPSSNVAYADLEYYKAVDIIDMLGLTIDVDGTPLEFKTADKQTLAALAAAVTAQEEEEDTVVDPRQIVRSAPRAAAASKQSDSSYKTVKVRNAGKYINKPVEITTMEGRVRSGVLEKVSDNRLYLLMRLHSGSLTYPIETGDISELRVRY